MTFKRMTSLAAILFFAGFTVLSSTAQVGASPKGYGVYQYVVTSAQGTFDEISQALENGLMQAGWRVLAKFDAGVPKNCSYHARVFVALDSAYAQQLMQANSTTAPFAVVDRINLFEDENGIHVSVVNPHSINRTVLMDDQAYEDMTEKHLQALRQAITSVVKGTVSEKQYGQFREKGYIGKTMGVMAGGKFVDKLVEKASLQNADWRDVAARVKEGLSQTSKKWGMHLVYELALPNYNTYVFGTTGTPMDSKSFSIVKAGSDKSRKGFKCPGLAYAGAYPIEVVVAQQGQKVVVHLIDEMFRMKMYFEDAGKWAFMKNMRMPGSIEDELAAQIKSGLQKLAKK